MLLCAVQASTDQWGDSNSNFSLLSLFTDWIAHWKDVDWPLVVTLCNALTKFKFVWDQKTVEKLKIEKSCWGQARKFRVVAEKVEKVCSGEVWSLDYVRRISSPFTIYCLFSKNTHLAHIFGLLFYNPDPILEYIWGHIFPKPQVASIKNVHNF